MSEPNQLLVFHETKTKKAKAEPRIQVNLRLPQSLADSLAAQADKTGLSRNELMLKILAGRPTETAADWAMVKALIKTNGDMGRVGGLLKMWLADDKRTARFSVGTLLAILGRLEAARDEIRQIIRDYSHKFF